MQGSKALRPSDATKPLRIKDLYVGLVCFMLPYTFRWVHVRVIEHPLGTQKPHPVTRQTLTLWEVVVEPVEITKGGPEQILQQQWEQDWYPLFYVNPQNYDPPKKRGRGIHIINT